MASFDSNTPEVGVYTDRQIADLLGVTVKTIQRECGRGRLPHCKVGRYIRITENQLRRYLEGEKA